MVARKKKVVRYVNVNVMRKVQDRKEKERNTMMLRKQQWHSPRVFMRTFWSNEHNRTEVMLLIFCCSFYSLPQDICFTEHRHLFGVFSVCFVPKRLIIIFPACFTYFEALRDTFRTKSGSSSLYLKPVKLTDDVERRRQKSQETIKPNPSTR